MHIHIYMYTCDFFNFFFFFFPCLFISYEFIKREKNVSAFIHSLTHYKVESVCMLVCIDECGVRMYAVRSVRIYVCGQRSSEYKYLSIYTAKRRQWFKYIHISTRSGYFITLLMSTSGNKVKASKSFNLINKCIFTDTDICLHKHT